FTSPRKFLALLLSGKIVRDSRSTCLPSCWAGINGDFLLLSAAITILSELTAAFCGVVRLNLLITQWIPFIGWRHVLGKYRPVGIFAVVIRSFQNRVIVTARIVSVGIPLRIEITTVIFRCFCQLFIHFIPLR